MYKRYEIFHRTQQIAMNVNIVRTTKQHTAHYAATFVKAVSS